MSHGFIAYTESGRPLISSDHASYHRIFGLELVTLGVSASSYRIYYPYATPPLVMLALGVGDSGFVYNFTSSGGYWTFAIAGQVHASPGKIFVFGERIPYSSGGYGLNIYNSAGELTFSSTDNPLWVAEHFFVPNTVTLSASADPNLDFAQISGTLSRAYTLPLFFCNVIFAGSGGRGGGAAFVGFKRNTSTTWCTARFGPIVSCGVRYVSMMVADYTG